MKENSINVLVTRPSGQAKSLCEKLSTKGFNVISYPTIEISPLETNPNTRAQLEDLQAYHFIIFVSVNAARHADRILAGKWPPINATVVAIGPKTQHVLEDLGLKVGLISTPPFSSEQLISAFPDSLNGQRILVIKGEGGRELLSNELIQRGASVKSIVVYRRVLPKSLSPFPTGAIDYVTVTSQLALDNFFTLCRGDVEEIKRQTCFVVFSQRLAQHAYAQGCKRVITTCQADDDGLVDEIVLSEK